MALSKSDVQIESYVRSSPPVLPDGVPQYLQNELQRIERSIRSLGLAAPAAADQEPKIKLNGMIRYAVDPWDPLGTGTNVHVYWDGNSGTWKPL
jgi:hypothetical protein